MHSKLIQLYIHIYYFSDAFHYRSLQDTECSSLWYTAGPCLIFIYYCVSVNPKSLIYTSRSPWASQVALVVKNSAACAGGIRAESSIPGSRRSPGGGHGSPLQFSCLENPMDRGACWATVPAVAKSQTPPKQYGTALLLTYL